MSSTEISGKKNLRERKVFHGKRARFLYELMGKSFKKAEHWRFMNYGYAFDNDADNPALSVEDEAERFCAQLYHVVASQVDLKGKRLLDVGSGRGGGASHVHRYLNPVETVGMDLASSAVAQCERVFSGIEGLSYLQGDSMDMPFEGESFDAVMNVESSHCYPDLGRFLSEVRRVLKPGGSFLYTDFTPSGSDGPAELAKSLAALKKAGFEGVTSTNITTNVVRGLELDEERRTSEIRKNFPFGTRRFARLWAGTTDSWIYEDFKNGSREYVVFHAKRPSFLAGP